MKRMIYVVIVCSDNRATALAKAMARSDVELWRVAGRASGLFNAVGADFEPVGIRWPLSVDLLLHHTGDEIEDISIVQPRLRKVARFNTTGTPPCNEGDCRLPPFPDAESCPVSEIDRDELIDWAIGLREQLPSIHGRPAVPVPNVLPALSILCQGYLAVQCGPDGTLEVGEGEDRAKILKALAEMAWPRALASEEVRRGLNPQLTAPESARRDSMRAAVATSTFWDVFDEKDPSKLKLAETAEKEWQGLNGGGEFGKVEDLIDKLPLQEGDSASGGFATLVAEAYIELAKRLGGAG